MIKAGSVLALPLSFQKSKYLLFVSSAGCQSSADSYADNEMNNQCEMLSWTEWAGNERDIKTEVYIVEKRTKK